MANNWQNYQFPWYTHCTNVNDWKAWSPPTAGGIIAGVGLLGGPFLGPGAIAAIPIGAVAGFMAVASVFDYLLGGKLVCLGGGADQIVCGTVTHLEPPVDTLIDFSASFPFIDGSNMDNDYSWNMLLCPYQLIPRRDSNGNLFTDAMGHPKYYDPQPYNLNSPGPFDYLCLETPEYKQIIKNYADDLVAPNPYANIVHMPGEEKHADEYFTALSQASGAGPLPAGFALPPGFPPGDITLPSNFPKTAGDKAISLFGQTDTPSGSVFDVNNYDFLANATTGLSAQMHCEIEGSRIANMQTAANVAVAIMTVAAVAAAAAALAGPLGWLLALLILFIAAIISAIVLGVTWALGSDPNVSGGSKDDATPNDGVEPAGNQLSLHVGDFVVVLGRWVFDAGHGTGAGSNELHPVKQVYVPTAKISPNDFCADFCSEATKLINSGNSQQTLNNQNLTLNSYALHPDVDGCEPTDNPPPPILK